MLHVYLLFDIHCGRDKCFENQPMINIVSWKLNFIIIIIYEFCHYPPILESLKVGHKS
jgi:hypothetical protein